MPVNLTPMEAPVAEAAPMFRPKTVTMIEPVGVRLVRTLEETLGASAVIAREMDPKSCGDGITYIWEGQGGIF